MIFRPQVDQQLVLQLLKDALPQQCRRQTLECDAQSKYRSVDGTCNNLRNPNWGSTNMPSVRLLPPAYEGDGTDDPRVTDLPPARDVSLAVHIGNGNAYELNVTHMAAQFGQFLDHDITYAYNCLKYSVHINTPDYSAINTNELSTG